MKFTGERVVPDAMHSNVDTYQSHLARYVWALQFCVGKKVLDAACGTGYGSKLLSTIGTAYGVDIDDKTVDYAERENHRNVWFKKDDLNNPQLSSFYYDLDIIITFETIEHLDNPVAFLKWCYANAPVAIGSIPIKCPTEFHKHVWHKQQIIDLLQSIGWKRVDFWTQWKSNINLGSQTHPAEQILFRGIR